MFNKTVTGIVTWVSDPVILKRIADWSEKVSVLAFGVGVFKEKIFSGLLVAIAALAISLIISKKIEGK